MKKENKRIKGYGEVAEVCYIDSTEEGIERVGILVESELKGTILKAEQEKN